MRPARTQAGLWLSALAACLSVLVTGCGGSSQAKLTPISAPEPVPADLCAVVPEAARAGLQDSSSADAVGTPSATCALHTPDDVKPVVAESITLIQYDSDDLAKTALRSQCERVDGTAYKTVDGFQVGGADQACGTQGATDPASLATVNAIVGEQLLIARVNINPTGQPPALQRAQTLVTGVLGSLGGSGASPSSSPSSPPTPSPASPSPSS